MAVIRQDDGRWLADFEPSRNKRFRRLFKTKAEALRFESVTRAKFATGEWNPKPKDSRKLSEIIDRWYDLHGHAITSGRRRKNVLQLMATRLGDPVASKLTGSMVMELRRVELDGGAVPKSINNRLSYLKSVFNELIKLGDINYPSPLATLRPLKFQERSLSFLTAEQIPVLLDALAARKRSPAVRLIAMVCLATGARWSEAESLKPELVRNDSVTFINTKSKRTRTVPISHQLLIQLHEFFAAYGPFPNCLATFRKAVDLSGLEFPKGQCSHIMRHTFASHFMMRGGNILTLKEVLGHASLMMTMRYAHLSPDHLRDALRLNPLDGTDTLPTQATKP